jgi:hypothetical protein
MAESRAPSQIAYAVVHRDPPEVFFAEDEHVLSRVLALQLVAQLPASEVSSPGRLESMRTALLDERWADALVEWITETDTVVDAYPSEEVWHEERLNLEQATMEIRVSPLFQSD